MSDIVKYKGVSSKKDQIAALYFTMSDIVHEKLVNQKLCNTVLILDALYLFEILKNCGNISPITYAKHFSIRL